MKILVAAKRVVDANIRVRVKLDYTDVDVEHSKMSLNPFDETAIEEAIRLKEQGIATEVVVLSVGGAKSEDILRTALAMGCDRAIFVESTTGYESINIAKIFAKIYEVEQPDIVLLGKQAIDNDANQMAQMLAGMLDIPQATSISKLTIANDKKTVIVNREVDSGIEELQITLPAVLSADLILNEPRFIKLPQIMQAKKKPVEKLTIAELNLDLHAKGRLISVADGEVKKNCTWLKSVDEVVAVIKKVGGC